MPYTPKKYAKKRMAEINVVPYIDVMLVLLVIFMVTAPMLSEGYRVQLPEAVAKPVKKSEQPPVIVSIDSKGRVYVNLGDKPEEPVLAEKLVTIVAARRKQYPDIPVLIKGDVSADYGKVINAMSILSRAGIDDFSLITQPGRP